MPLQSKTSKHKETKWRWKLRVNCPSLSLEVRRVADKRFPRMKSQKLYSFRNRENSKRPLNDEREKKTCTRCGRDRSHTTCPAAEKECFNCCKVSHFWAQGFSRKSEICKNKLLDCVVVMIRVIPDKTLLSHLIPIPNFTDVWAKIGYTGGQRTK